MRLIDLAPIAFLVALASAPGCLTPHSSVGTADSAWPDAAGAIEDPALATLAEEYWEAVLEASPIWASSLGDARALGRLPDESQAARRTRRAESVRLREATLGLDDALLVPEDRITRALLLDELDSSLAMHDAGLGLWVVNPRRSIHTRLFNLARDQPSRTPAERRLMVERWAGMGRVVRVTLRNLDLSRRAGLVGNESSVKTTIEQLDRILGQDVDEWPIGSPPLDPAMPSFERRQLLDAIRRILADDLRPELIRYRNYLVQRILPVARSDETPGLASLPDGPALYATLIRAHTGLALTADELHAFGLAEVARIRTEIAALSPAILDADTMPSGEAERVRAVQERLRADPALHFRTRDEVEQKAVDSLARARDVMADWFGVLPQAPCDVVRIAAHEERETTIAYYNGPAADGSKPGRYYINTYAPETRPRYDAEVLAFHEAIPGHHLQIAIAQERVGLPRFRRSGGTTAFIEGWALYTERLCDEMGLYTSDVDRLGVLSFDAWRACRLVVDTGLHAFGWSRQRAIDYMLENTLLAPNNVENEVDRYITTPAQALAYKTGQREILSLRAEAEQVLGPAFDIREFHDVVLGSGAVSLGVLRRNVEQWIAATLGPTGG
jgi:uncharacterized protein (DUF885 family)